MNKLISALCTHLISVLKMSSNLIIFQDLPECQRSSNKIAIILMVMTNNKI